MPQDHYKLVARYNRLKESYEELEKKFKTQVILNRKLMATVQQQRFPMIKLLELLTKLTKERSTVFEKTSLIGNNEFEMVKHKGVHEGLEIAINDIDVLMTFVKNPNITNLVGEYKKFVNLP